MKLRNLEKLDIESEVAIHFHLKPEDRKVALEAEQKRIQAREAEIKEMEKEGFDNLFDFRQYKNQFEKPESEVSEFVCPKCGTEFETAAQLRGHNMTCGKKTAVV